MYTIEKVFGKAYRPWNQWEIRTNYVDTDTGKITHSVLTFGAKEPDDKAMNVRVQAELDRLNAIEKVVVTEVQLDETIRMADEELVKYQAIKDEAIAEKALLTVDIVREK